MFRRPITFVIGAGASHELGLPLGNGLLSQIGTLLATSENNFDFYGFANRDFENRITEAIQNKHIMHDGATFRAAADEILKAIPLAKSIDNLLFSKSEDTAIVELGKAAIANCIYHAEATSALLSQERGAQHRELKPLNNAYLQNTWFTKLAAELFAGTTKSTFKNSLKHVRFVVFNYDRCLEQFLWMATKAYFDVDDHAASELLSEVQFIHPYGDLGELPWQQKSDGVPYGKPIRSNPFEISKRLMTFGESVGSETSDQIRDAMTQAETLIFLGFGFLSQNMELLGGASAEQMYGTAFKVSDIDRESTTRWLRLAFRRKHGSEPYLKDTQCAGLLNELSITLGEL